jgi:hypothetical protein
MKELHLNGKRFCIIAIQLLLLFLAVCTQKSFALSPPTISPGYGLFSTSQTVTISAPAGTIYFTTDGTTPTTSSQVYSSSLTVSNTTTINAIAVQSGVSSSITTAILTFDPTTVLFGLYPPEWLFRSDVGVTSSAGAVSNWLELKGTGINASQTTTSKQPSLILNALNGHPGIQTGSNKYFNLPTITELPPEPVFYFITKPNSTSNGALIDISPSGTANDDISYSVAAPSATLTANQGSTPASLTASSTVSAGQYAELEMGFSQTTSNFAFIYTNGQLSTSGSLGIPPGYTFYSNHIGTDYLSNFYDGSLYEVLLASSATGVANPDPYFFSRYQLLSLNPQAPIISVPTGSLSGPTQVAISVPADTVCNYTLDGTTPTSTSPSYREPINIFYSQTLNAIAFKNGFSSSVVSATYTLDSTQWPAPNSSDTTPLQVNVQSPN